MKINLNTFTPFQRRINPSIELIDISVEIWNNQYVVGAITFHLVLLGFGFELFIGLKRRNYGKVF